MNFRILFKTTGTQTLNNGFDQNLRNLMNSQSQTNFLTNFLNTTSNDDDLIANKEQFNDYLGNNEVFFF